MNVFLWVLQILLGLHTAVGAVWKFSHNAEQTMPTLAAIPNGAWWAFCFLEILCSIGFFIPAYKKQFGIWTPIAAILIALEMGILSYVHLSSGDTNLGPIYYWATVAILCVFTAVGRMFIKPLHK